MRSSCIAHHRHSVWQVILICAVIECGVSFVPLAAQEPEKLASPSASVHVWVGRPITNVELPANIVAPAGRLSFVANFQGATGNGVPLFLVNRTARPVEFDSQD